MPPKKGAGSKPSGKTVEKVKKKIVEDRTFGLKNKKKSAKVQKFVTEVKTNVKFAGKSRKEVKDEETRKLEKKAKKEGDKKLEQEMASLFKAVVGKKQEVAKDVDPKSVLCEHFKAGSCKFGKKCKFSHDLEVARKATKINLYHDPREMAEDTIDKWDQEKLEAVVASQEKKRPNETKIVCKYFLDAVENLKYGWRWTCPNGETCIYKHALPEGFVFKRAADKKAEEEEGDKGPTLEEEIEIERKKLDLSKCTPVTLERFQAWKEEKKKKKAEEVEKKRKEEAKKTGGKGLHVLSGRDLFIYDPSLFVDDEGAAENDEYETREELEEEKQEKIYNSDSDGEDADKNGEVKEGDGSEETGDGDKEKREKKAKTGKDKEKEKPKESKGKEKEGEKKETPTEGGEEKKSDGKKKKKKKKKAGEAEKDTAAKGKEKTAPEPAPTPAASGANFVNQELFLADEDLPDEDEL